MPLDSKKIFIMIIVLLAAAGTLFALQQTLTGEADDMQGYCKVEVVKDGNKIISVSIIDGRENVEMSDDELQIYLNALTAADDWNSVDAVTGATMSCDLIKKAVFDALQN